MTVKFFYGRELLDNNLVLPYYVKSDDNVADGLTKNQPEGLFSKHSDIVMNGLVPARPCNEDDLILALDQLQRRNSAR